jgi:N-acetyl-1-D-myo-inositol-2-amino-2-deoxy-alpha-D-glucopyranoside deacetylase
MRYLIVVAHPDDETFGCGSILAHAAGAGHETIVLCATRGEAGESRVAAGDIGALREAELRDAARILGVSTVRVLDYADSGMSGEPPADALAAADAARVAAAVTAVLDELRPDVVVTLDASDGHRDHAVIRDATLAAVDAAPDPPAATYLSCLARSSMARWADHVRATTGDDSVDLGLGDLGTPDSEITTVVDVTAHLPRRWAAIAAHASQASPYDDLPPDLQHEFLATDRLRLVRGTDVLAGGYGAAASATSTSEARSSPASTRTIGRSTAVR